MGMFRRLRKGWEIVANGVTVKVVSGRAAVQIDADKAIKVDVRKRKAQNGLQSRRRLP